MKKQSDLQRLLSYAGKRGILTSFSWILSAASALSALVPFYFIWRILKEVIEVSPDFGKAVNVTRYGWLAVIFAAAAILVYIGGLMCSHLSAFRIATNLRIDLTKHIASLPLGTIELRNRQAAPNCLGNRRRRGNISRTSAPRQIQSDGDYFGPSRAAVYI